MHYAPYATLLVVLVAATACRPADRDDAADPSVPPRAPPAAALQNEEAARLADAVHELFIPGGPGTELRAQLFVQVLDPTVSEETPLAQRELPSPSEPGPHTQDGVLHADLDVLRQLFASGDELVVDDDRVHFPARDVTILAHRHGDALYVPVRLFARQYGAYARIWNPLGTTGVIWPREILEYWRDHGPGGAPALLEAEADGLITGVAGRPRPGDF